MNVAVCVTFSTKSGARTTSTPQLGRLVKPSRGTTHARSGAVAPSGVAVAFGSAHRRRRGNWRSTGSKNRSNPSRLERTRSLATITRALRPVLSSVSGASTESQSQATRHVALAIPAAALPGIVLCSD
jgi:hypothetical protein